MNDETADNVDLKYWVAFGRIPRIGRARFSLLEKHFGKLENAWTASAAELRAAGLDQASITSIVAARPEISPDAELDALQRAHVDALTWNHPSYPPKLKEIYDLPPVLYVRGQLDSADEWAVAVVGTRRATPYGRQVVEQFATRPRPQQRDRRQRAGARHRRRRASSGPRRRRPHHRRAGLRAGHGLPAGARASWRRRSWSSGALITDYPLGTQPRSEYFPRRNRIMSGISLGVLVVEGDVKSGAMITARLAAGTESRGLRRAGQHLRADVPRHQQAHPGR